MDTELMLWVHGHATPLLDWAFRFSNLLGTLPFCAALVAAIAVWNLIRRKRREASLWVVVGLATYAVPELLKAAVARPRPQLWPWLVTVTGWSFPSGHAVAGAALYPLLSFLALRGRMPAPLAFAPGLAVAAFVGAGRVYLGVHWPSDVIAGWLIGLACSILAAIWIGTTRGSRSGAAFGSAAAESRRRGWRRAPAPRSRRRR